MSQFKKMVPGGKSKKFGGMRSRRGDSAPFSGRMRSTDSEMWEQGAEFSGRASGSNPPRKKSPLTTGTKILITNLQPDISEEDMRQLCTSHGTMKSVEMFYNKEGISKGTCEVTYYKYDEAVAATTDFNDRELDGKPMRVNIVGGLKPTKKAAPVASRYEEDDDEDIYTPAQTRFVVKGMDRAQLRENGGKRFVKRGDGERRFVKKVRSNETSFQGKRNGRQGRDVRKVNGNNKRGRGDKPVKLSVNDLDAQLAAYKNPGVAKAGKKESKKNGKKGEAPKKTSGDLDAELEAYRTKTA